MKDVNTLPYELVTRLRVYVTLLPIVLICFREVSTNKKRKKKHYIYKHDRVLRWLRWLVVDLYRVHVQYFTSTAYTHTHTRYI